MTIGVVFPAADPLLRRHWSGTPAGIADGLRDIGITPVGIGVSQSLVERKIVAVLSRATGRRGESAHRTLIKQLSRDRHLARAMGAAGELSGVIFLNCEAYTLGRVRPRGIPAATFDDSTLAGMWAHPESEIRASGYRERDVEAWSRRQAASMAAADVCCVSSQWAGDSLIDGYGIPADRVRVVGIGHRPLVPAVDDAVRADDAVRPDDVPRFLFVGLDWRRKNGAAVVRAFRKVRAEWPDAQLHVVGRHPLLDEPGVIGHGELHRESAADQQLLARLFAEATAFVLPGKFEPAGIAYLEAASAGLPVIVTSEGGAPELLSAGSIVVDPGDDEAIARAMLALSDPREARAVGRAAARASTSMTWSAVARRIVAAMGLEAPSTAMSA